MANFAQPIHNPIDDLTTEELQELCSNHGLVEDGELDDLEHWKLLEILEDYASELQADW